MGRGKDCLIWIEIRLTSLAPSSCWAGECLTLPSQTRIIIALIQISRRLVIFFFHLMTWDMDCAFIYGFIVKQACFMPWHSDSFIVCVCVCVHFVAQSCPTLCNPMDCIHPSSSVHGIFQARILEQVAISYSRGSSQPKDWNCIFRICIFVSVLTSRFFTPCHLRSFLEAIINLQWSPRMS